MAKDHKSDKFQVACFGRPPVSADDDEKRFNEELGKIAEAKPSGSDAKRPEHKHLDPTAVAGSSFIDELSEGVTVRLDSVGSAPSDKFVRVDYDPNSEVSALLAVALPILSEFAPSFIIPGHFGRVKHDFENACILLRLEPHHAGSVFSANYS
jgi:hypothetical protein